MMLFISTIPTSTASIPPEGSIFVRKSKSFCRNVAARGLLSRGFSRARRKLALSAGKEPHWLDSSSAALKFSPALAMALWPLPSSAAEAEQMFQKINIESIVVGIDDFFNRNPFFVSGVIFVWLVVIPLTQEYFSKCKKIGALDAFRRLRDVPEAQLLDIRKRESVRFMASPNLKLLGKKATQVEFVETEEEDFVKNVLEGFGDPAKTILCVLDNFDDNSLKAAELLYKNGFKEAYAIKGGLRGKDGWEAIQETYLPPSLHVLPRRKKSKASRHLEVNGERTTTAQGSDNATANSNNEDNREADVDGSLAGNQSIRRPLSPYPNYPDLKPPSSPTPSKPRIYSVADENKNDHLSS